MRVTNKMLAKHSLSNLYGNMKRLDKVNEQLSSGKKIQRPSDDPVGTTKVLKLRSSLKEIEQYKANVERGVGYLETIDTALGEIGDILRRGRELATYGANGTLNEEERGAIADEVDQLIEHAIQIGNTSHAGRFVFGYNRTDQPPFGVDQASGTITFLGETLIKENGEIAPGWDSVSPSSGSGVEIGVGIILDLRVPGDDALGAALSALVKLRNVLDPQYGPGSGDVSSVLSDFDQALDETLKWRSETGAKMKRLEMTNNRLDDLVLSTRTLLSKTEDIDVAETIMNLKMEENAYRLALSSGARIIQPTLMDFLR